ncbi:MAG: hypothetical protein RLZZ385_2349 [Pseudomonadota bacterium]
MNNPTIVRIPLLVLLLSLSWASGVLAQQGGDVSGAADHPLLQRFNSSFIVDYRQQASINYELVLGPMIRAAGRVSPEESRRLRGLVTRITYEVPESFAGADVFGFFDDQVRAGGFTVLFTCAGRECGNSNYWANDVFDNRILYGPERSQYYLAAAIEGPQGTTRYLALYVVTRANRRIYAHAEIVETDAAGVQPIHDLLIDLQQHGALVVPGLLFNDNDELLASEPLAAIVPMLLDNPQVNVIVVAHLRGAAPLERLLARSQQRADNVRDALVAAGVADEQIGARGLGPLAPLCGADGCDERIELVLQPE